MNLNTVIVSGNLTADPELKYLPSGAAVCQFNIGVNRKWKDKAGELQEEVSFIKVTAWSKTAENVANYLAKGSSVVVEGYLKQERWEEKDGKKRDRTGVVANAVHFTGKPKGQGRADGGNGGATDQPEGEDTPF